MTPSKDQVLRSLNQAAIADHQEASERAQRMGRQAPAVPVSLTPDNIEFPKWLHRGWKASAKGDGHQEPKESKLIKNDAEQAASLADGWTEEPPKAQAKK